MKTGFSPLKLACLATFGLFCASAQATTINWGTYISPTSYLFDSAGTNLDDTYVFELGSFGSFVPTAANESSWLANWKPFDRATAPFSSGWNSSIGNVAHSATLQTDFTSDSTTVPHTYTFATGEQAYIWAYKDINGNFSPTPGVGMEWALVTNDSSDGVVADNWTFPVPSGHVVSTLDWRIEDATATPFGGLNNVQGPGGFSNTPTDFILQTHTVAAVPEPGSAILLTLGLLVRTMRFRRRKCEV